MTEIAAALRDATQRLIAASDTPRLDAELLMAHALGTERQMLLLHPAQFSLPADFGALVDRRCAHEPIAYIIGWREFWSLRIGVGPGVLIPRPDSETLIEAALEHFDGKEAPQRILDLGTGPGTLLLAALKEWRSAQGVGVDASSVALDYARANAAALDMDRRADFRIGDWADGIECAFDLILCNPPYIGEGEALMPDVVGHEPHEALFAGDDGLADYRRIIPALSHLLAPAGVAIIEIGATQRADVTALGKAAGFAVTCRPDLGGRDRALIMQRAESD